ncbi:MAG: hypothetical protein ACLT3H_12560 [Roseburia sp.]
MEKKQTLLEAVTKDTKEISISRADSRSLLQIGTEQIEVSDYQIKSSADGSTELSVTIKGAAAIFETSASLG